MSESFAAFSASNENVSIKSRRRSKRISMTSLYLSLAAAEHDTEVNDDLSKAQILLSDLKNQISLQSKKNFVLERDVRYLDSRIALLIQNRIALDEQNFLSGNTDSLRDALDTHVLENKYELNYGYLFYLLQSEPYYLARLCQVINMSEIDSLLQTVIFTIFGNQYDSREENLLLSIFQHILAFQFEEATDISTLLRANTPFSRMLTTYTRRGHGQTYLKRILSGLIQELSQSKLDLEINPGKLSPALSSTEREVEISSRVERLCSIVNKLIIVIVENIEHTPYGVRWICKQVRSLCRRNFPGCTDEDVRSLIGGFFFLRYINPAIVNPTGYMLMDKPPADPIRRSLTLIAKVLQHVSNRTTVLKEDYMAPLTQCIDKQRPRVGKFLQDLCNVSDFYETLELDQYSALSKTITLNIAINELFCTHKLLNYYVDAISPSGNSHLRIILRDLGAVPSLAPQGKDYTIKLQIFSRFERSIRQLNDSLDLTKADVLYMETKSIFVQLYRMGHARNTSDSLYCIGRDASVSVDSFISSKGLTALRFLEECVNMGLVDEEKDYSPLSEEVKNEISHLGSLQEKIIKEAESLRTIYDDICKHNEYLTSQIETYKSYLQTVRLQSQTNSNGRLLSLGIKRSKSPKVTGKPNKLSHAYLEKEGVIAGSTLPEFRKSNIYWIFSCPAPGTFFISLNNKDREGAVIDVEVKLDDLLEMQQNSIDLLDLGYVKMNVAKLIVVVNKLFK